MKKWNQATAAALLTVFVMTGALPAHAEKPATPAPTQGQEVKKPTVPADMLQEKQAIAQVRKLLGGLAEFKYATAWYETNPYLSKNPVWSISFSTANAEDSSKGPVGLAQTTIDAKTGELLRYNIQNPQWAGDSYPTDEGAVKGADEFLRKTNPELVPHLMEGVVTGRNVTGGFLDEMGKERRYTATEVKYYERVNDIPFHSNTVHISVDQYGHVVDYFKQFLFDSSQLPKPEGIISQEKATDAFANELGMNLYYQTRTPFLTDKGEFGTKDEPGLIYSLDRVVAIDAHTGKPVEEYLRNAEIRRTTYKVQGENKPLVAKNKEAAVKLITELTQTDLSKLQFQEERYTSHGAASETISYVWHEDMAPGNAKDGETRRPVYITANFDAVTGQLMQLYRAGHSSNERAFTIDDGISRALDIVSEYAPQGEQELMLTATSDFHQMQAAPAWFDPSKSAHITRMADEGRYSYQFSVLHEGIPVMDQYYMVDLDPQNGQLLSLSLPTGNQVQLPESKNAVQADVVEQNFIKNHPLTRVYFWEEYFDQQAPAGKLIYVPEWSELNYSHTDALTGTEVYFNKR